MKDIFVLVLLLILSGCANIYQKPIYTPPTEPRGTFENTVIIEKPFDDVWTALIEASAESFFAIKNFEKDSGLLTLSFGSGNPGIYVNCGFINARSINIKGMYVDVLQTTGYAELKGAINLFVKPIDENSTRVTVNTRYIFTGKDGALPKKVWVFDGKETASHQTGVIYVTCRATLRAEKDILSRINSIAAEK